MEPDLLPLGSGSPGFPNTRWSLVVQAGGNADEQARSALAHLCREYWYPLYAYVRRRGFAAHDAQDLTQSFMLEIISGPSSSLRTGTEVTLLTESYCSGQKRLMA